MKTLFTSAIFVCLFFQTILAANPTVTFVTQPAAIVTCSKGLFTINLHYTAVESSPTILQFSFPAGVELADIESIDAGASATIIGSTIEVTATAGFTGDIVLTYSIIPSCGNFSASTISAQNHSFEVFVNGVSQGVNTSGIYAINSPYLLLTAATNLNPIGLSLFTDYTRTLTYTNTTNQSFTGEVSFTDATIFNSANTTVNFSANHQVVSTGTISNVTSNFTATSATYSFHIAGLAPSGTITITETLKLIKCSGIANLSNSNTDFNLVYGCTGQTPCESASEGSLNVANSASSNTNAPGISYNLLEPEYSACFTDNHPRLLEIVNTGNAIASTMNFTVFGLSPQLGPDYKLSYIDVNSVQVFTFLNGVETPFSFHTVGPPNNSLSNPDGNNPLGVSYQVFETDATIPPGTVLHIRYNELFHCPTQIETDLMFNGGYSFSDCYVQVFFDHPCFPTLKYNADGLISNGVAGGRHIMSFKQEFNNLEHPSVGLDEIADFHINEALPFVAGLTVPGGFAFDLNTAEIVIELKIEPGFEVQAGSIEIVSHQGINGDVVLTASSVTIPPSLQSAASGGIAIARFPFPAGSFVNTPQVTDVAGDVTRERGRYYGNRSNPTPYFDVFFNDFEVDFTLIAHCETVINSQATIQQSLYISPNGGCSNECLLPLSRVSDNILFLCPGCILPGFQVSNFDINRTTLGASDNDNNHLPDMNPTAPDPDQIELKHVMVNDEIQMDIEARIFDGETYAFSNGLFNVNLDEGRVFVHGTFLNNLEFLGATGTLNGLPFTVSAAPSETPTYWLFSDNTFALPNTTINLFSIDVGVAALQHYGYPNGSFSAFAYNDHLVLQLRFRVRNNLVNNISPTPLFSVEEPETQVYMSGEPFTGYAQRGDANETVIPIDTYGSLLLPERESLDYWCTGAIARLLGVGIDFNIDEFEPDFDGNGNSDWVNLEESNHAFNIDVRIDPEYIRNPCYKIMHQANFIGIGEYTQNRYFVPFMSSSLKDAFPYELRNLWNRTSIDVELPSSDYELDQVVLDFGQFLYNPTENSHGYDHFIMKLPPTHPSISTSGTTLTVDLTTLYNQNINLRDKVNGLYQYQEGFILAYDEGSINDLYFIFKMNNCQVDVAPDLENVSDLTITQNFDPLTFPLVGISTSSNNVPNTNFDKPSVILTAIPSNFSTTNGNWDVQIATPDAVYDSPSYDDQVNNHARNSFVYFVSNSGNITVNSISVNGITITSNGTVDGYPRFDLGQLGFDYFGTYHLANLHINASFNCETVTTDDLRVVYGWGCYGYPTTIGDACFSDELTLQYASVPVGIQATLTGNTTIETCGEETYILNLHATDGDVENLQVDVTLPSTLDYSAGTGVVLYNGQTYIVPVTGAAPNWHFDLSAIPALNGINGLDAQLVFGLTGSCVTGMSTIEAVIDFTNDCGYPQPIVSTTLDVSGNVNSSPSIISFNQVGLCENGTATIVIEVNNTTATNQDITVYDANQLVIGSVNVNPGIGTYTFTINPINDIGQNEITFSWSACDCHSTDVYSFTCTTPCESNADFAVQNVCEGGLITVVPEITTGNHSWVIDYGSFQVNSNNTFASFPSWTPGTYTITHTFTPPLPCTPVVETMTVTVYETVESSLVYLGSNPLCEGSEATITVLNPELFTDFEWTNGSTDPAITVNTAGTYGVTLTDLNGCQTSCPAITISTAALPENYTNNVTICAGQSTTLVGLPGYDHYLWSNGATTSSITVNAAGTYTLTYCNGPMGTCCGTGTYLVQQQTLTFDLPNFVLCSGSSQVVTSPLNGPGYTYNWYEGGTQISTSSSISVSNGGVYSLQVTTPNGCSFTDFFTVSTAPVLNAAFTVSSSVACIGSESICFVPSATVGVTSYNWSFTQNGSTISSSQQSPCMIFSQSGIVNVSLTVSNSCSSWTTTQAVSVVAPQVSCIEVIGSNPMCPGETVTLTVTGNPTTINWYNSNQILIGTGSSITVNQAGVYTVQTTDANGCVSTCCTFLEAATVLVQDLPNRTICAVNGTTTYTLTSGTGAWSNGNYGTSQTFTTPGTYYVDITTPQGCTYRDYFTVSTSPLSGLIAVNSGTKKCAVSLSAVSVIGNGVTYSWYVNTVTPANLIGTGPGLSYQYQGPNAWVTFILVLTDINGCTFQTTYLKEFKNCNGHAIVVFPNPFNTTVNLNYELSNYTSAEVQITNMLGSAVYRAPINTKETELTISTAQLSMGSYLLHVYADGELVGTELIVKTE